MTYEIIEGAINKERVEGEKLLVIGALKSDIIKCNSLIVFGHIVSRKLILCDEVLIIGQGRIYNMISKKTILIPTSGPISITGLKTIELIIHGKKYPVIIHDVETIKGFIIHGLIDEIKGRKLVVSEKTRIRNLAACTELVFKDPLVSFENISCKPTRIIFNYEPVDY